MLERAPSPSPDLLHIIVQFHNQEVDIDRIHGLYEDLHTLIFMCLYLVLSNFIATQYGTIRYYLKK